MGSFVRYPVAKSVDGLFDTTEFSDEMRLHLGFESKTAELIEYHELVQSVDCNKYHIRQYQYHKPH